MAAPEVSKHGMWSSRWVFILAAAGSAVGLGNIWKFPYIAGQNGGGLFVIFYLVCIALIGVPIMMSEVLLGRAGRKSPINTMRDHAKAAGASQWWSIIGWMGAFCGFLILSYYAVVAGWVLSYVAKYSTFQGSPLNDHTAGPAFAKLLDSPEVMIFWHSLFVGITIWVVGRGVGKGLELVFRYIMPLLFVLLIVLVGYGVTTDGFMDGVRFMFALDFDNFSFDSALAAMGQAFFTLSLGMGAIMAYGAYMQADARIGPTIFTVAIMDTIVAVAAGLAVFPIVFANNLEPAAGPGLIFVTVPIAFAQLPGGEIFGFLFFLLISFAALTSAISLCEPAVTWLVEDYNAKRMRATITFGVFAWLLGLASIFSSNIWSDVLILGMNLFDFFGFVTDQLLLPLGGLLIAVFAGFILKREVLVEQLGFSGGLLTLWLVLARFVAPAAVVVVFVLGIYSTFS